MNDGSTGSLLILLLPLLLIVFMALSARKRQRTMENFNGSLAVGEQVVTTSGIYGRITELDEGTVRLEVAPGTTITLDRRAVGMRAADVPGLPGASERGTEQRTTDTPTEDER